MKNDLRVHIALFLVGTFHAINYTVVKRIAPEFLSAESLIFLRMSFTCVLFWLAYLFVKKEKISPKKDYLRFFLLSVFGTTINVVFYFKGLSITTQTNTALAMTCTPIFVFIISVIWLREKFTILNLTGIFLATVGYVMLIGGENMRFDSATIHGDIMVMINAVSYGTYLILVKPLMDKYHPLTVFRWTFLFGSIMIFVYAFPYLQQEDWGSLGSTIYIFIGYIVVFATFLTFLFTAWSLKYATASVVSVYLYLQPVLAGAVAVGVGDEVITLQKVLYSLIILTGVYLVGRKITDHTKNQSDNAVSNE